MRHFFDSFEVMYATLIGLADIHGRPHARSNRIVHADVKPDNLFILKKPRKKINSVFRMPVNERMIKFIDFGVSVQSGDKYVGGTRSYKYHTESEIAKRGHDIYSLAISFLTFITGKMPRHEDMQHKARISKCISENSSGSKFIDDIAIEIIRQCARAATQSSITDRHTYVLNNLSY